MTGCIPMNCAGLLPRLRAFRGMCYSPFFEFVLQSGTYAAEHRLAPCDGKYRFYWLEATIQHDPQGKEEAAVVCATDITSLKQQQDLLRHSEGRLKEAQRIAQLGHWELDLTADRMSISEELMRILEFGSASRTHGDWLALVHPEDRAAVDETFAASVRERRLYDCPSSVSIAGRPGQVGSRPRRDAL